MVIATTIATRYIHYYTILHTPYGESIIIYPTCKDRYPDRNNEKFSFEVSQAGG